MEPRISAKRIGRLLPPGAPLVGERTLREYVSALRAEVHPRRAFVHRTHLPGDTMELDFGHAEARIAGKLAKVCYLVATLTASNAYFAKAYFCERLECLLDGILAACVWFGGMPRRAVFDNASLAVQRVLRGRERIEQAAFHAFRGELPLLVEYCAPRQAHEKGSVEGGVGYVRGACFRPRPEAASLAALNSAIVLELEHDLARRKLPDGRSCAQALAEERTTLRPLPAHLPATCRVIAKVADKFGHVRLDGRTYSVPIAHAWQPVVAKLFHDKVELCVKERLVATHARGFGVGELVLDPLHVLPLLEQKHRAVPEATALKGWKLPAVFYELRERLSDLTRKPDQEWVSVLRLLEVHAQDEVERAVQVALARGSPRHATIALLLRQASERAVVVAPVASLREELAAVTVAVPELSRYDALHAVAPLCESALLGAAS